MAKRRKSKDELAAERWEADSRAWELFRPRLESAKSIADLVLLLTNAVAEGAPGRKHYSNLGFFLSSEFVVPAGANATEISHYARIVEGDDALKLEPQARQALAERIRQSGGRAF